MRKTGKSKIIEKFSAICYKERDDKKKQLENMALLYEKVRSVLEKARRSTQIAVNAAMVQAYWQIGMLKTNKAARDGLNMERGF